jgi:hypothetical protein
MLFAGAITRSSNAPAPPPEEAAQAVIPVMEEASAPVTPAKPDLPSLVKGGTASGGVSGGFVVVRNPPTSSRPAAAGGPRRSHIQGEFMQNESGSGPVTSRAKKGLAAPPLRPKHESLEPQLPAVELESSRQTPDGGGPSAPGGFVDQWTGISNTGWIPPDTQGAVGPNHYVEAVNSSFAIYTKFGTQVQAPTTFDGFLNEPAGWTGFMFDPRVIYDPWHNKFVMLILGKDDAALQSYFWIAMSQTSDPTAGWWIWRFNATVAGLNGAGNSWLDYAGLSADNWGLYVTGNYFAFTGGFRGSNLWSINPDIFNNGATNGWRFLDLRWPGNQQAFAIQPALPHSAPASQTSFFVNTFSGSGSQVLLWKLTGDRTNAPGLVSAAIGTAGYEAIGNNIDQPGSATDIDGGDARVMNAVYSQGHVFFVLTDDVNNNGDAAGWLTVKLDINANTNVFQHLLWGGVGFYYFYPAITIQGSSSANNNVAVFGSWTDTEVAISAGTAFASGLFKIYDNQPAATTGPFVSHTGGLAAYVALDSSGRNRWGDYSGASYDWTCQHAWGAVEAADTGNDWRTVINGVQFGTEPICPQIEVSVPNGGEVWNAGTNHLITWQRQGLCATCNIFVTVERAGVSTQIAGPLANTATSFNWAVSGAPSGAARIFVGSWTGSAYEEFDRSNANFTITAPDLRVINPSVSANLLLPGDAFTANATANNLGNGSSNVATTLRYYRSTDAVISTADLQVATDPIPVLGAGGSSVQSAPLTAPAVGNYWIGACVDAVGGESNVANQCSTGVPITVTRPDLIISAINAPLTATQGQTINVANTVQNQGTIGTGVGFNVGLYLSVDATCNTSDTLLTNRAAPALAPGAVHAANTSVTIPLSASVGNPRHICAVADSGSVIVETNEANNIATDTIQILALVPTVNLKANGIDAVFPAAVTTTGPLLLTLDMTPGPVSLDHYFAIIIGGNVLWVTSVGTSTTPAPLATFTPVTLTNLTLINQNWSPGTSFFMWLMLNGGTVVEDDLIQVNVVP